MRNIRIEEVMNGWKVFTNNSKTITVTTLTVSVVNIPSAIEEYVFADWNEMMEFIADYFAEEEE